MGTPEKALKNFTTLMRGQMLRVNVLLTGNAILMGVMVGIGAYGHRYRHHPLTRFFFIGATTLFLPIVSYIVSNTRSKLTIAAGEGIARTVCDSGTHKNLVVLWAAIVQIIGINTTAIVAADDSEAGRSIAPPAGLLVQAVWTTYLAVSILIESSIKEPQDVMIALIFLTPFILLFTKIFLKYYGWYSARQSFSFGRNPRLIVGNMMEQLPADDSQHAADQQDVPPPLIVSRENTMLVGKHPHGYRIIPGNLSNSTSSSGRSRSGAHHRLSTINNQTGCLVTIDQVWELDDMLLKSTAQLKDVCFSFALFKMLRCRFARYSVTEAAGFTRARDFLWHVLLEDSDGTRTLGVIATELSFLHDYYNSSLPISYSKDWLPISSIFISLLSMGFCLFLFVLAIPLVLDSEGQVSCRLTMDDKDIHDVSFGNLFLDGVPLLLVAALVVLSEVREIASYICSDWTKVALMCRYVSWHEYPKLRKCIVRLMQRRCKLVRPWRDDMNQCSIIVLHPRKFNPMALLRRVIPKLSEPKRKVKVSREVKAAIVDTLRSSSRGDDLRNGKMTWQQLGIEAGGSFLRAQGVHGTSDTLLAWHIATTIFEARHPPSPASSGNVATHLSRYCAYLVAHSPELLPDDDKWSKSLYKAAKKDAERALRDAAAPKLEYRQLVDLLSAPESKNEVLQEGARLGKQLVEELMKNADQDAAWKALAGFWCEMILHMAHSDKLDRHAMAIARGGELDHNAPLGAAHPGQYTRGHPDGCFS